MRAANYFFSIFAATAAAGAYRRCRRAEPPKAEAPAAAVAAKIAKQTMTITITKSKFPSLAHVKNTKEFNR